MFNRLICIKNNYNFLDSQMPRLFSLHFHIFWILHFHILWILHFHIFCILHFHIFCILRFYIFTSLHLYIFTSFAFFELLYSSFFPSEFPFQKKAIFRKKNMLFLLLSKIAYYFHYFFGFQINLQFLGN